MKRRGKAQPYSRALARLRYSPVGPGGILTCTGSGVKENRDLCRGTLEMGHNYYDSVVADQGSEAKAQEFVRLFMVPGMNHCSGGAGPDTFNALAALEQWVEKGTAPTSIPASKVAAGKTVFARPLCPYPQVETYKGSGDINDAANFSCAAPK